MWLEIKKQNRHIIEIVIVIYLQLKFFSLTDAYSLFQDGLPSNNHAKGKKNSNIYKVFFKKI